MNEKLLMQMSLIDQVTKPLQGITKEMTQASELGKQGLQNVATGTAGIVAAGFAVQNALMPAIEMDRKLGEVASLGVTGDALKQLQVTALEFSAEYGKSATDFVAASYDIQSAIAGLDGNELSQFTKASGVLAAATKADTSTITNYMGTMYGIFKNQATEMGKGTWVELVAGQTASAVQMFKTTGAEMSSAFTSVGANATSAGIAMSEQMAILGTLQATMSGSEAGTKYKAFLAGVAKAQDKLNLSFTDSQGQMLPMLDILDKLKGQYGDTLSVAEAADLKKAFGSEEAVSMIKLLMADTDGLASSIETLGNVQGMSKAEEMASKMTDQWERLESSWFAVRAAVFGAILPSINAVVGSLADGIVWLTGWTDEFPWLTELLGYAAIAGLSLGGVVAGLSLAMGIGQMMSGGWAVTMGALNGVLKLMRILTFNAATGTWALNTALLANPLFWMGAIVIGAIAAMIYWWDDLKASFGDTAVFKFLSDTIDWVIDKLNMIPGIDIDLSSSGSPELEAATVAEKAERKPIPTMEDFSASTTVQTNAQLPPQMVQNFTAPASSRSVGNQTHIGEVHITTEGGFTPEQMEEWEALSNG